MHIQHMGKGFQRFVHAHDDLPAFHAGFIVFTFLVAAMFPISVFALLIAAHMALDFVKYREVHGLSFPLTAKGILRESLFDVTLLTIGLVSAVYLHWSSGLVALSGVYRSLGFLLRSLGMFFPKLKVLYHTVGVITDLHAHMRITRPWLRAQWSLFEFACFALLIFSVGLLCFTPAVLLFAKEDILRIFARELRLWRL